MHQTKGESEMRGLPRLAASMLFALLSASAVAQSGSTFGA